MTLPDFRYAIILPPILLKSSRLDQQYTRDGLRSELEHHHRTRIPGHFRRTATQKYGYARRISRVGKLSYAVWKSRRYGSNADLVKTGRSRRAMTSQRQITVGGSRARGGRTGRLVLRFPFPGGTGRLFSARRHGVDIDEMVREVRAITPDELRQIGDGLAAYYAQRVSTETSPRQRLR